jgi:hypothetical protein
MIQVPHILSFQVTIFASDSSFTSCDRMDLHVPFWPTGKGYLFVSTELSKIATILSTPFQQYLTWDKFVSEYKNSQLFFAIAYVVWFISMLIGLIEYYLDVLHNNMAAIGGGNNTRNVFICVRKSKH